MCTAAGRKRGSVSQKPVAYRAPPRKRLSPAARATTAPPRPASAMFTKHLVVVAPSPVPVTAQVTVPTSMARTPSPARCLAAWAASPGRPNDRTKSQPEPGRHHPEHGVGRDRPAIGDHPVDHLVHGSVAADRDQEALTGLERVPGGLGGVAGMGGPDDAVVKLEAAQDVLHLREGRVHLSPPGPRVGNHHQGSEGAAHGGSRWLVTAAGPPGS